MKRNTMMRLASVLLVAVLLSTCTIAGTYAKYVSDFNPTSSARVAKWAFKIEGKDAKNETITFDLFDTINDATTGNEDENVAKTEKVIAPGTKGSFQIDLVNESEVTAKYKIRYTMTNIDEIPIKFSLDQSKWVDDIKDLYKPTTGEEEEEYYSEFYTLEMSQNTVTTPTVYWKWDIGNDDANEKDTTLGENGEATIAITADIVVEQVD